MAHQCLEEARAKCKGYYDRKKIHREMKVGDKALILLPSDSNKMLMQWKGPFMITAKRNEVDYEFEVGGKRKVFHVNRLKKYEERAELDQAQPSCSAATGSGMAGTESGEEDVDEIPTLTLTRQQTEKDVLVNQDWIQYTSNTFWI